MAGAAVSKECYQQQERRLTNKQELMVVCLHDVQQPQIRWQDRLKDDRGKTCKVTVDGTDFRIPRQRPHSRDRQYYSHKFKHAALRYEVAVCIQTGLMVWINGPFRAGKWPDVNIFRRDLKGKLLPGEMIEADRGYRDPSVRHCDVVVSRSDARAKSRAMRRHETVNSDLKTFGCLNQQWRHELGKHSVAFSSCAFLIQMKYKLEGGPKFHCKY